MKKAALEAKMYLTNTGSITVDPLADIEKQNIEIYLNIPRTNQVTFITNSLKSYGPKIWNALPFSIKTAENLKAFKTLIKKWNGASCNCIICSQ